MKEQVHLPIGEGSDKSQEEGSAPKELSRPQVPKGLAKPKVADRKLVGYRCHCGSTYMRHADGGPDGCRKVPTYEDELDLKAQPLSWDTLSDQSQYTEFRLKPGVTP